MGDIEKTTEGKAMKRWLYRHRAKHLIQVKRNIKDTETTLGFVTDFNDQLLLFSYLCPNTFALNGYVVIRVRDISAYRVFDKNDYWQHRAIKKLKIHPVGLQNINLSSIEELVTTVSPQFPLVGFELEFKKPGVMYIGKLMSVTEKTILIEDLNANGEWSGPRRLKTSDITSITFGDGYQNALALTAPPLPKRANE